MTERFHSKSAMKIVKSFLPLALATLVAVGVIGCGSKAEPDATAPAAPKGDMPASKSAATQQAKPMAAPPGVQTGTK